MSDVKPDPATDETDLYGWALRHAELVREGRFSELEIDHLAEELEDIGMSRYDKLESALRVLLLHILKWDRQPERRSRSSVLTIKEQRQRIERVLKRNPSLKRERDNAVTAAREDARVLAARETGLPLKGFPLVSPYGWPEIMDRVFAPED